MSPAYRPVDPATLYDVIAARLADVPGTVRVAVDGPPCAQPDEFAVSLAEPLRLLGRPFEHIRAESFWHDASLRLEQGREDVTSLPTWLDADALRREVLDPIRSGTFLPSLRDPSTNRVTREPPRRAAPGTVLVVSGSLLLGLGLPFDVTIHLAVSAAARVRRTPADCSWTLPAFDDYDADVRPSEIADVVVRWDDPRHPALSTTRAG